MRTGISLIALTTALVMTSAPAQALDLGVTVGDSVGVEVGVGSDGVDVDANVGDDVDAGGGLDVDADVELGGGDGLSVDANADVGNERGIDVDANVELGRETVTGPNGGPLIDIGSPAQGRIVDVGTDQEGLRVDVLPGSTPRASRPVAGGIQLTALNEAARVDALIDLIDRPDLANVDIDVVVDDRLVSITPIADLLGDGDLARISAAIELGGSGREQLLDALRGSLELTSILSQQGIDLGDVLAVQIDSDGSADIIVLGGAAELVADIGNLVDGAGGTGGSSTSPLDGLTSLELADLDIDLLSDDQLAVIDLTLLPTEPQRLQAIVRLLDTSPASPGPSSGSAGDTITIVDLQTLLGDEALADVEATLGIGNGAIADLDLSAEVLGALEDAGIPAAAVVGVTVGANGQTQVLVDLNLGGTQVADIDIGLGGGGTGGGGTGGGGTGDGGTGDGGSGDGGTGDGGTDDGGTDDGDTGAGDTGGTGGPGGSGDGGVGDPGNPVDVGGGTPGPDTGPIVGTSPAAPSGELFASLDCDPGLTALTTGTAPTPVAVRMAKSLELVVLTGCEVALDAGNAPMLGQTLNANPALAASLQSARISLDDIIGATVSDGVVTVFIRRANA